MKNFKYLAMFFIIFFTSIVNVRANSIDKITMDIYVDKQGNAHITETWKAYLNKGSEGYHPYYNLGNSYFSDFTVTDDSQTTYTYRDSWDVDDSFSEKKYSNGIYKNGNETDLCWGISKYGNRTYTLKYTINNFIYNTTDNYQILFWQLIPYDMNPKPDDVYIKIYSDEKYSSTLDVWGYGNYGGTAYVYDGYIEMMSPEDGLSSSDYMTILVKFPNGYFNTDNTINKSFDEIFDGAEEGSTKYIQEEETDDLFEIVFVFLEIFIFVIIPILIAIFSSKKSGKIKNKVYPKKDVLAFRDLPFKDNYSLAYLIASEYNLNKKDTDFLGAVILKWIKDGNVNVTTEEKGIFKNKSTKIELLRAPVESKELELYNMMVSASKDNILENKEFEKYCKVHYSKVLNWFDTTKTYEYNNLKSNLEYINNVMVKGTFGREKQILGATDKLNEKASQMAGLKVFFKEFTSLHEKEAIEVKMWRDYLIYAQIFGMAKEVAKEFKDLYPDVISDEMYNNVVLIHSFSSSSVSAASQARQRAQSYSSGGGGFSSGGGGGGSFGGGGGGGGFR